MLVLRNKQEAYQGLDRRLKEQILLLRKVRKPRLREGDLALNP